MNESGLTDLTLMALVLAIPLTARAVLVVAWYRYRRPKWAAGTWIDKGHHRLGLPRPMLIGAACGVLLATMALLVVVAGQYGPGEVIGLVFLALVVLVLISVATAAGAGGSPGSRNATNRMPAAAITRTGPRSTPNRSHRRV